MALSIPFARKHSKETGSASWERDSDGNFEHHEKVEHQAEFLVIEAGPGF